MKKIGDYWVPDVDTFWFRNLRKTRQNYENGGQGTQLHHLTGAIGHIRAAVGTERLAAGVAIDAGANIGAYSRHMAADFLHVHAFEPAPDTYECLARNVADWGLKDRVTTYPNALSAQEEGVSMGSGGWFRRSISREVSGPGNIRAFPVDSLKLDNVLLLKLDVEGYELKVLTGSTQTLARCRPFVMIELKDRKIAKGTADMAPHEFLLTQGYEVVLKLGEPSIDRLYATRA